MIDKQYLIDFINESNKIEQIYRDATEQEIIEIERFINLDEITIKELENFLSIYQPNAQLRNKYDMDVRIGSYLPPFGGPDIEIRLKYLLNYPLPNPYRQHLRYEELHPFTDGNGRSGRALWLWRMIKLGLDIKGGFLINFYFQTLQSFTNENN